MRYFSCYIPREYVGDVKRALLPAIEELQASIFSNCLPGRESEDSRWGRLIAFRDLFICLEGADKAEQEVSVTPFTSESREALVMHDEARFYFRKEEEKEG